MHVTNFSLRIERHGWGGQVALQFSNWKINKLIFCTVQKGIVDAVYYHVMALEQDLFSQLGTHVVSHIPSSNQMTANSQRMLKLFFPAEFCQYFKLI